ncbi:MAG: Crp/Fnr family transcriptional regulator [Fuerstiella sp.]
MSNVEGQLKACTTLRDLSQSQLSTLALDCELLSVARGTTLYDETDLATHVYLLAAGRVQISHTDDLGHRSILNWVTPGKLFGEFAVCMTEPQEERADLVENSVVLSIPANSLQQLTKESPEVSFQLLSIFGSRRQKIERRIKSLMFRSTGHRLASLLLELAEPRSGVIESESRVPKISHQDLASMIGVARETVTITLGQLRAQGIIRIENRQIIISEHDLLIKSTVQPSRKRPPTCN